MMCGGGLEIGIGQYFLGRGRTIVEAREPEDFSGGIINGIKSSPGAACGDFLGRKCVRKI